MVRPLSEETYKVQFTASRALRDKLKRAQDLLRHQLGDGDLAEIVERGLNLLIEKVEKERFAVGHKPRKAVEDCAGNSRNSPLTSGASSTSATEAVAPYSRRKAADAPPRVGSSSTTSMAGRERMSTRPTE